MTHENREIQVVQEEIAEIKALTPPESREERLQRAADMAQAYTKLREKLKAASDPAVAQLTLEDHRLARVEFDGRLDKGGRFPLGVLFEVARPLSNSSVTGKGDRKLYERIAGAIGRYTPTALAEEVIDLFGRFAGSQLDLNTNLLDVVLSHREDMDGIASSVAADAKRRGHLEMQQLVWDMNNRILRAKMIREARSSKPS